MRTGAKFERLVEIMAQLRGPNGCPWDKQQSLDTLGPMLIEEVYEVVEAADTRDYPGLAEELGDLLLHIVFRAELGRELGEFGIDEIIDGICEKLVRRHPHVFGEETAATAAEVVENWEAIKKREKQARAGSESEAPESVLESIPAKLPALHEAHKISSRVARVGFDWARIEDVFEKLQEEIRELEHELAAPAERRSGQDIEAEIGDAFFTLVNIARFLEVDSESALKRANRKFRSRFRYLEEELTREGRTPSEASLEEMESIWQRAKQRES